MIKITTLEGLFISVTVIQLIYWLGWLIGVVKIKKTSFKKKGHGVSVIIAANNELVNLKKLLPSLLNQNYNLYEIIIIDDRSSDGSSDFLLEQEKQHSTLKVLRVESKKPQFNAKKYAITLGVKSARYDQLLLTDADCKIPSKNWIGTFANYWNNNIFFILGFSAYRKKKGFLNYFIRYETILTGIQYMASAIMGNPYMGVGRNISYAKTLFLSNKGFFGYENLMGGDDDIFVNKYANRLNTTILLSPESINTSIAKTNIKDFFIQKIRHLSVGKYYLLKDKFFLGVFMLTWVLTLCLFPFALLMANNLLASGLVFLIRYLLIGTVFYVFLKKSGEKFNLVGVIFLDFIFILYYFVLGVFLFCTKKIKWS